ncbi:MAPEG family protein [Devosia sp.]|uniref:MAPEG family protein n=1 Tax=Devosia sp. TaxID=1871048 RepID=UPI00292D8B51|nr:MAPEG family protein [Devosia sp.]
MLLIIFLVLFLLLIQVALPGRYLTEQVGTDAQIGPRDDLPEPSRDLGRARRALANLQETLPVFLTLALLSILLGEQGWLSLAGGALYFVARVAHLCGAPLLLYARPYALAVGQFSRQPAGQPAPGAAAAAPSLELGAKGLAKHAHCH